MSRPALLSGRAARGRVWGPALVVALAVALAVGLAGRLMLGAGLAYSVPALADSTRAGAVAVGQAVAGQFARALDLGIPLARLPDVAPYLERIARDAPQVQALALLDADGRPLAATAERVEGERIAISGAAGEATLVVAAASPLLDEAMARLRAALTLTALLAGAAAGAVTAGFLGLAQAPARRRLRRAVERAAEGDFAQAPPPGARGRFAEAAEALGAQVERVQAARLRLMEAAATIRAIDFDGSLGRRIEPVLAAVAARWTLPATEEEELDPRRALASPGAAVPGSAAPAVSSPAEPSLPSPEPAQPQSAQPRPAPMPSALLAATPAAAASVVSASLAEPHADDPAASRPPVREAAAPGPAALGPRPSETAPPAFDPAADAGACRLALTLAIWTGAAPLVANFALDRGSEWASPAWQPAVPLLIELAALLLGALAGRGAAGRVALLRALALALTGACLAATYWCRSWELFAALRLGAGLGAGFAGAALAKAFAPAASPRAVRALLIFAALVAGPLLGGLLGEAVGRRAAFLALGLAALLATPALAAGAPSARLAPARHAPEPPATRALAAMAAAAAAAAALVALPLGAGYDDYLSGGGLAAAIGLAALLAPRLPTAAGAVALGLAGLAQLVAAPPAMLAADLPAALASPAASLAALLLASLAMGAALGAAAPARGGRGGLAALALGAAAGLAAAGLARALAAPMGAPTLVFAALALLAALLLRRREG
ncbi:hypothetical protein P2H44_15380 [Albimonas sp. CAU 1670]|uniref:hypothetical protein n=1 Tax=Albimonas sp. CAU 1670 TaxID=3032599 RepID=UPI0023DC319C|nr:hypothetical protein [Albimonas sp. CAU 1670]MDF2233942.1 hypothetical protein [Albimonas sp. CAU 1670]